MRMIRQIPELADSGYWYVVRAVEDEVEGGYRPDFPASGTGWCAWYGTVGGERLCAVRTPDPVARVDTADVPVSAVLAAAEAEGSIPAGGRPYGRIGGR